MSLQVSTVTACVQRDAGGQTVRYPATAKTVLPAPLMRGPVNVLLDTEALPAKGVRTGLCSYCVLTVNQVHLYSNH